MSGTEARQPRYARAYAGFFVREVDMDLSVGTLVIAALGAAIILAFLFIPRILH